MVTLLQQHTACCCFSSSAAIICHIAQPPTCTVEWPRALHCVLWPLSQARRLQCCPSGMAELPLASLCAVCNCCSDGKLLWVCSTGLLLLLLLSPSACSTARLCAKASGTDWWCCRKWAASSTRERARAPVFGFGIWRSPRGMVILKLWPTNLKKPCMVHITRTGSRKLEIAYGSAHMARKEVT